MASLEGEGAGDGPPFPKPCQACRRRKVKCDKLTRPCANCARTKQLCIYDGDEPPVRQSVEATSSTDSDVRDRLARLERLMEAVIVGENKHGGGATRSPLGAGNGLAVAKDPPSDLTRMSPNSPSPPRSFHTNSARLVTPVIESSSAPVGQILFQEGHSAYFDSDFWAGLITEVCSFQSLRHMDFTDNKSSRLKI